MAEIIYVESAELRIRILIADAFLERAHRIFRWDSLGPYDV